MHLASLEHEGAVESWHDRRINPGEDLAAAIDAQTWIPFTNSMSNSRAREPVSYLDVAMLGVAKGWLQDHVCSSSVVIRHVQDRKSVV